MDPCDDYTHKGASLIVKDESTLTWSQGDGKDCTK